MGVKFSFSRKRRRRM